MLKRWLDENGVEYTNYTVDTNPYAAQMMASKSGQRGVPFSTIEYDDGTMDSVLGFDREKFKTILANSTKH